MTQTSNRVLDEFAKLMTDAAGVAQGVRREVETAVRSQAERFLGDMDVVQREEFEAVRDMAAKARAENESLRRRLDALESRLVPGALPGASDPLGGPAKTGAFKGTGTGAADDKGGDI
jgi:BMFP domain-containing protein YqiC